MSTPDQFYGVLESALLCICTAMDDLKAQDETYAGCPCNSAVTAGESVINCCTEDDCDGPGGMLTVSMDNFYPSDVFPQQTPTFEPCKAQTWVVEVVVTVARCAPQPDVRGHEPDAIATAEAARIQAMDGFAIATGLGCCLVADGIGHKRKRRVQFLSGNSLTESGGCIGLEVHALVEAGQVCGCQEES